MRAYEQILLATQTIQWLALRQTQTTDQIRGLIKDPMGVIAESVKTDDGVIAGLTQQLVQIANDLGDYMNAHDSVDENDEKVVNGALSILNEKLNG